LRRPDDRDAHERVLAEIAALAGSIVKELRSTITLTEAVAQFQEEKLLAIGFCFDTLSTGSCWPETACLAKG
jgi:hypothetical protein